jgi:hypothetical protein
MEISAIFASQRRIFAVKSYIKILDMTPVTCPHGSDCTAGLGFRRHVAPERDACYGRSGIRRGKVNRCGMRNILGSAHAASERYSARAGHDRSCIL